jgi:hypothetical protein
MSQHFAVGFVSPKAGDFSLTGVRFAFGGHFVCDRGFDWLKD